MVREVEAGENCIRADFQLRELTACRLGNRAARKAHDPVDSTLIFERLDREIDFDGAAGSFQSRAAAQYSVACLRPPRKVTRIGYKRKDFSDWNTQLNALNIKLSHFPSSGSGNLVPDALDSLHRASVTDYLTTTPAYPTTLSRSPEMSPDVAYFTNSADLAPSFLAAVSIATAGPKPHMLMSCCLTTS
jgi:hypothetical protein